MPGRPGPDVVPEHSSIKSSRSRQSISATLRRKTSHLFRHKVSHDGDLKETPSWRHPARGRSIQRRLPVIAGSQSPHSSQAEFQNPADIIGATAPSEGPSSQSHQPPPASAAPPAPGPLRRRLSKAGTFIRHPFQGRKIDSATAELGAPGGSPWPIFEKSEKEKLESVLAPAMPPSCPSNSRSSFRSSNQQPVQDMDDDDSRLSGVPARLPNLPARPPLRTLWTIMSGNSSEERGSLDMLANAVPGFAKIACPELPPISSGFEWEAPAHDTNGLTRTLTGPEVACKRTCLCHKCCMTSPTSQPQSPARATVLQEMQNKGGQQTIPGSKAELVDEPLWGSNNKQAETLI
ncbi:hypothetical protein BT67DRAFT_2700 [Trichocladium antarcticum]|uniref:Uncharacterized protein n=1 Tax=Trichocladium antarcticum TaxID=1450529 RepID=A0AAN6US43_9PEZI|nr:hypothetical protein BT67DRAFT_2700 [Trichocladium antarcticum]